MLVLKFQILIKNRLSANKIDEIHIFYFIIYKIRTKMSVKYFSFDSLRKANRILLEFLYRFRITLITSNS